MVFRQKDFRFSVAISWRGLVVFGGLTIFVLLLTFGKDDLLYQVFQGFREWLIK